MTNYIVPPAALNTRSGVEIACTDATHPIPDNWLKANAGRFYFAYEQIAEAALPKPETDDPMREYDRRSINGVYFLLQKNVIVYVGQTNHVFRRIAQHLNNDVNFDRFAWFEAPLFFLKDIESYYIDRFDPPMNTEKHGSAFFAGHVIQAG
jgi:hypothetical protein